MFKKIGLEEVRFLHFFEPMLFPGVSAKRCFAAVVCAFSLCLASVELRAQDTQNFISKCQTVVSSVLGASPEIDARERELIRRANDPQFPGVPHEIGELIRGYSSLKDLMRVIRQIPFEKRDQPLAFKLVRAFGSEFSRYVKEFNLSRAQRVTFATLSASRPLAVAGFPLNGYLGLKSFDAIEYFELTKAELLHLAPHAAKLNPYSVLRNLPRLGLSRHEQQDLALQIAEQNLEALQLRNQGPVQLRPQQLGPAGEMSASRFLLSETRMYRAFREMEQEEPSLAVYAKKYGLPVDVRKQLFLKELSIFPNKAINALSEYNLPEDMIADLIETALLYPIDDVEKLLRDRYGKDRIRDLEKRKELAEKRFLRFPERAIDELPAFRLIAPSLSAVFLVGLKQRIGFGMLSAVEKELISRAFSAEPLLVTHQLLNKMGYDLASPNDVYSLPTDGIVDRLSKKFSFLPLAHLKELKPGLEDIDTDTRSSRLNRIYWTLFELALRADKLRSVDAIDFDQLVADLTGLDVLLLRGARANVPSSYLKLIEAAVNFQGLRRVLADQSDLQLSRPFFGGAIFTKLTFDEKDWQAERQIENLTSLYHRLYELDGVSLLQGQQQNGSNQAILQQFKQGFRGERVSPEDVAKFLAAARKALSRAVGNLVHLSAFQEPPFTKLFIDRLRGQWGDLDSLFVYLARMQVDRFRPLVLKHHEQTDFELLMEALRLYAIGQFDQFRFYGRPDWKEDQKIVQDQLKPLTPEQLGSWTTSPAIVTHLGSRVVNYTDDMIQELSTLLPQDETADDFVIDESEVMSLRGFKRDPRSLLEGNTDPDFSRTYSRHLRSLLRSVLNRGDLIETYELWKAVKKIHAALDPQSEWNKKLGIGLGRITSEYKVATEPHPEFLTVALYTHDLKTLLEIGTCVQETCQHLESGGFFESLLGYALDPNVKVGLHFLVPNQIDDYFSEHDRKAIAQLIAEGRPSSAAWWTHLGGKLELSFLTKEGRIVRFTSRKEISPFAREIVRVGADKDQAAKLFFENIYSNLKRDDLNYTHPKSQIHKGVSQLWRIPIREANETIFFPRSRNPGGVYSDFARGIQMGPFLIDGERKALELQQ